MGFASDMTRVALRVEAATQEQFVNIVNAAMDSIVNGSPVTGAPGQPVDTGNLKASWQEDFESPTAATISTNVVYARPIEDGVGPHGPLTLRSAVGGFHSVGLTIAGFGAIVAAEKAAG